MEAAASCWVDLRAGIPISAPPSSKRIAFPFPTHTPPFEVLSTRRLGELLGLPAAETAAASVQRGGPITGLVSSREDVSSSPEGVCMICARMFLLTHSHAGCHADQPLHFLRHSDLAAENAFPAFPDDCYLGPCVVVSLADLLQTAPTGRSRITVDVLRDGLGRAGLLEPAAAQQARRLLFATYSVSAGYPAGWDPDFPYFEPEAAHFLVASFPELRLVGTDAASVDAPHASPIIKTSHGEFWARRVAILEGLQFPSADIRWAPSVAGVLQTIWNPMQICEDAKGCVCLFFPMGR